MRSRNIKPGFFENESLGSLSYEARILFIGLWCIADREGRFEWRPMRIKALIFPYDNIDVECNLMSLHAMTLILQYKVENVTYGVIPKFKKHQNPHPHEAKSILPDPRDGEIVYFDKTKKTEQFQCHDMSLNVTKCNADILNPDILNPDIQNTLSPKIDPDVWAFVERFQKNAKLEHGNLGIEVTDGLLKSCYKTIDQLIRLDKFEKAYIFETIRWAYKDSFWSTQVRSLSQLRIKSKKNGLSKFQNIVNSMQKLPVMNGFKSTGSKITDNNIKSAMEFVNE